MSQTSFVAARLGKRVNSTSLMPSRDMGGDDGSFIARDVYGFHLNYYAGDYNSINGGKNVFPGHTAYMTTGAGEFEMISSRFFKGSVPIVIYPESAEIT